MTTILTKLTREDALLILDAGEVFLKESRFKDEQYNRDKVWQLFDATVTQPDRFFITYVKSDSGDILGFLILGVQERFFSNHRSASDFSCYVHPDFRGSSLFVKMLKKGFDWCKEIKADSLTIYHNTGIDSEKAISLFTKLGFSMNGYIFSKEVN